ncbi:MAG: hypothetical protein HDR80_00180 [Bacteroides sp.]|nr:hypothetical protein [Bacteroides sp.]
MKNKYLKMAWDGQPFPITYYTEFEGDYAVKDLEISENYVVLLDDEHPVIDDDWLTDGRLSDIDFELAGEDGIFGEFISAEEFYSVWNRMKEKYGFGRTILSPTTPKNHESEVDEDFA